MKNLLSLFSAVLVVFGIALVCERQAHAYADPGSGLMAIQIIGATLSGVGFYLRHKIARLFGRKPAAGAVIAGDGAIDPTSAASSEKIAG
jgi:hypothetical protein